MSVANPVLTASEVTRLSAVASRLQSDHDGEVVSAGRMLVRLLGKHNLCIADVIERALAPRSMRSGATPQGWSGSSQRDHQRQAAECLSCGPIGSLWSKREDAFLRDMLLWPREPSPAQAEWLAALVSKARAGRPQ